MKPAAEKSSSKASASWILSERISAKLVASTNEYSRSPCRRSHRRASCSSCSETDTIVESRPSFEVVEEGECVAVAARSAQQRPRFAADVVRGHDGCAPCSLRSRTASSCHWSARAGEGDPERGVGKRQTRIGAVVNARGVVGAPLRHPDKAPQGVFLDRRERLDPLAHVQANKRRLGGPLLRALGGREPRRGLRRS